MRAAGTSSPAGATRRHRPEDADVDVPVADCLSLALRGRPLPASDRRVLGAFAAYAAVGARPAAAGGRGAGGQADRRGRPDAHRAARRGQPRPAHAARLGQGRRDQPADADIEWTAEDREELLATADESLDRLTHLVDNLLDMSRLQAGALSVFPRPAGLDEIVSRSRWTRSARRPRGVRSTSRRRCPRSSPTRRMLERVIANLTANALRYSPAGTPPLLSASALGDRVELRVVDRGPGIPEEDRDRMFAPFQRLGDTDNTTGVGLGLALSRGLTEAMGGTLIPEDTPGGGLTMMISLPVAAQADYACEPGRQRARGDGP